MLPNLGMLQVFVWTVLTQQETCRNFKALPYEQWKETNYYDHYAPIT